MTMPVRFLGAALVTLSIACTPTPAARQAPSAPAHAGPPSAPPRFDGVYAAKAEGGPPDPGWDYLRFLDGGKVLSISSSAAPETAVSFLYSPSDRPARGTYELKNGTLRFVLRSKLGAVAYEGGVHDDHLVARWRSEINGAAAEETFSFVPVSQPAEAPAPQLPESLDPALLPDGQGWFCFRGAEAGSSRCGRTLAACEATRREAAAGSSPPATPKLSRCTKQKNASCHSIAEKSSGKAIAVCYESSEDCHASVAVLLGADDAPGYTLSACTQE